MSDPRITRFQDLVAKNPANEMFRFSLAQALDTAGETAAAQEHYEICVAAKSDWMLPRINLGKLKLKSGDESAAKTLLEDALQLAIAQDHEDPAMELQELLTKLS
ncbi:MAG: molecular chaperone DnaJ [Opitutaceae bacterium]|jgi:Flp pilus assembly protein TadD|nr:molecular chaperone DnaJ [Opitutaceae bacterium]